MSQQIEQTRTFFDNVSVNYKNQYKDRSPYHYYFFNERLEKATAGLDFNGKKVLDIGSGTGNLYDHIHSSSPDVDFYATDISAEMLKQSNVPATNKFPGICYDINLPIDEFDFIFMLGVTAYLSAEEFEKILNYIAQKLKNEGTAIISFTNKRSYDIKMRTLLKLPSQLFLRNKKNVLLQNFKFYTHSVPEVRSIFESKFEVKKIDYLNHTIYPISKLFPAYSLKRAKKIREKKYTDAFLDRNSSDFLVNLTLK